MEGENHNRTYALPQKTETWCVHHRPPLGQHCPHRVALGKSRQRMASCRVQRTPTQPNFNRLYGGGWAPHFGSHCLAHALFSQKVRNEGLDSIWLFGSRSLSTFRILGMILPTLQVSVSTPNLCYGEHSTK